MAITKEIFIDVDVDDKDLKGLNKELKKTSDNSKEAGKTINSMSNSLDKATGGAITKFKGLQQGLKSAVLGFKSLRVAIIATGIGALLVALTSLATFFTKTQRGADLLSKAMKGIGAAASVVIDRISLLGEGLFKFFQGDFSGAFDNLKGSVSGLTDEIIRETQAAIELEESFQRLRDTENELIVVNAQRRKEIAKNRLIAEDEEESINNRIAALDKATALEAEILADQLAIAKKRAETIAAEVELGESLDEDIKKREEARARVIELETQSLEFQKRIITRRNALVRQGEAERRAIEAEAERQRKEREKQIEEERKNDRLDELIDFENLKVAAIEDSVEKEAMARLRGLETERQISEASKKIAQEEAEAKQKLLEGTAQALTNLTLIAGQETGAGKALAVAASLINTYAAIAGNLKAFSGVPIPGYAIAQAIATGAAGFAAVRNILQTKVPNEKGGSPAGGGNISGGGQAAAPSFNVVGEGGINQIAQTLNQDQQPVQAFVVGSNVTTQQELDRNITETASIG